MRVEIRIGRVTKDSPNYSVEMGDYFDNPIEEKIYIYKYIRESSNVILKNVNAYLLYAVNNCIAAYLVKDNTDLIKDMASDGDVDYENIPKLNPESVKIYEISEDGTEICIQNKEGLIGKNYFNRLMNEIMNDYYLCLAYFKD